MLGGVLLLAPGAPALPAFPGAEGYGANATGGRGGDVYYVTSLEDYSPKDQPIPGSLRQGLESAKQPRTILFQISGNIHLKAALEVCQSRLTIAGQTAPGDGICLCDYSLVLNASDLILRHLRVRLGTAARQEADALSISSGTNVIVDHCSTSWSVDETLSPANRAQNLTVQWTYITESLNRSIHSKGPHGYGSLIRPRIDACYSFHHNLYAHHSSRNPRAGTYDQKILHLDFRNNVIYNWGFKAGYNNYPEEGLELNYVGNYLLSGPSTTYYLSAFDSVATNTLIFQSGNRFDVNHNGRVDGSDTGWQMFAGAYRRSLTALAAPPITTDPAEVAYERILAQAGATPWRRDPVDTRVTASVRAQAGQVIDATDQVGGWPDLKTAKPPLDSDLDGMPDFWERALGCNPLDGTDRNQITTTGYTQLEEYLQWLAEPQLVGTCDTAVEADLRALSGHSGEALQFAICQAEHGKVSLGFNGYVVRFVPNQGFAGRASFSYKAVSRATGVTVGPVSVGVLLTPAPTKVNGTP